MLVALVTGLAGCSSGDRIDPVPVPAPSSAAPASDPAADPALARFYGQRAGWADCGDGLECAKVTVPVDWKAPAGATLELSVARHRASGTRIGSLFFNPGGPGVSTVDWMRTSVEPYFDASIRDAYDIVGWDPRGVAGSAGIRCITDPHRIDQLMAVDSTPDTPAEQSALDASNTAFAEACRQSAGAVLGHVDSLSTARDLDVLRAVVGDRTLQYQGASYGTFIGALYAQTFPWRVGRMVLDGAIDPALTAEQYAAGQAVGFDRAVSAYLAACLGREGCPWRGTPAEARAQLGDLLRTADATPLRTDSDRALTESLMSTAIIASMYVTSRWKQLNEAFTKALQGDGTALLALADEYNRRKPDGSYDTSVQAYSPIWCLDHPNTSGLAATEARARVLGEKYPPLGRYIGEVYAGCLSWPEKPVLTPQKVTAPGAPPIVVVGTTNDPATPYEWAQSLAAGMRSGVLVTRKGDGHAAYRHGSTCIDSAIDRYLVAGTVPDRGLTCS